MMIKIENLEKEYGSYRLKLSMEIEEGRVSGLVGSNGAGKSTTIKAILGLINPTSGMVTVFGKNAKELNAKDKENIGVAMSDSGFSTYLNVSDVIKILRNLYSSFDEDDFKKKCKQWGLPLDKKIKDFSTGMKAKLRVLIALSHKAKLLILDEPTAGLDVMARNEILDVLRDYLMEDEERTLLISSHISSDLEGLCDDIYMIHNGKLVFHEDTDVLLGEYALLKVTESQYEKIDMKYVVKKKKENYGYALLTNEKKFYQENYPDVIMENGSIDELIIMMAGGEE